ncbi:MAG: DNA-3-methyladenine glycosylase family protein [Rhodothalassiaceae bacterium]
MDAAPQSGFMLDDHAIRNSLDRLAAERGFVAQAVHRHGYPTQRRHAPGFATLMRILVGQQVSTMADEGIWARLGTALGEITPQRVLAAEDLPGLSRNKKRYARALAEAVTQGMLDLDTVSMLDDTAAVAQITQVTGFGPWSAQIYLMFGLGRPDVWPAGDLAVRAGIASILQLDAVPDVAAADPLADRYRPHRSAVALLSWHVYNNPAL